MAEGGDFDVVLEQHDNPAFDPDDLPDPVLDPPLDMQQSMITSGDHIQSLKDELRQQQLETQKQRLVKAFYTEIERDYHLQQENIDYRQFEVDDDAKPL